VTAGLASPSRPFVISDSGDNPTAGGAGDTSFTLAYLLTVDALTSGVATAIHASITDPDARTYRKSHNTASILCYQGHVLMENRSGLVVGAEASQSATNAEREVALELLDRVLVTAQPRNREQQVTVGADTQYQEEKFVEGLRQRKIAPHISEYVKGNLGKNSLNETERADPRRTISQQKRKLIERVFGWSKLDRPLRQVKLRGLKRVDWFFRLAITAYNLVRMRRLIPFSA